MAFISCSASQIFIFVYGMNFIVLMNGDIYMSYFKKNFQ